MLVYLRAYNPYPMKRICAFWTMLLMSITSVAQWNNNPAVNTFVSGTQKDMSFPKITITPQGTYYVSFLKNIPSSDTSFNYWLQKLDQDGNPMWGGDGIRISDQPCRTWVSDYTLRSDAAGNALITFEDMRGGPGGSHVVAYKISPDGTSLWPSQGVDLFSDSINSYSPMMNLTNSGNLIIAWDAGFETIVAISDTVNKSYIRMQKVSPSGALLWSHPVLIAELDSSARFPVITPVANDDFILCWQRRKYPPNPNPGSPWDTWIYAQRFNSNGEAVWPEKVKICEFTGDTIERLPIYFNVQTAQDENQGVFFSWFDDRYQTNYWNVYVQHVDTAGALRWPLNGIPVSMENFGYNRVDSRLAYDQVSKDIYVVWDEDDPSGGFSNFGMVGQRIGMDGTRKWGDMGKVFIDFVNDTSWNVIDVKLTPERTLLSIVDRQFLQIIPPDTLIFNQLFAMKMDSLGNSLWNPSRKLLATTEGTKYYPMVTGFGNSSYVIGWGENRDSHFNSVGSVYAQNIQLDGSIGPLGVRDIPSFSNNQNVMVCPNPTVGKRSDAIFKNLPHEPVLISVSNIAGHVVSTFQGSVSPESRSIELNAAGLPPGVYLVKISTNSGTECTRWVVL